MQDANPTSIRQSDLIDPARANAMQALLGLEPVFSAGDPLPPFFHHLYFWEARPPSSLGRDGHPRVGMGAIPDMGLPRRMWAGGRLDFLSPLKAGLPAEKQTTLETATPKQGRSGPLAFVTLRHNFFQGGTCCIREHQDLVYRPDPAPGQPAPTPPMAPRDEDIARPCHFDTTMLFRYSALTFNGHRIHYDLDYARQVENYPGLVVHGPLLAQLLMLLASDEMGPLSGFHFRATAPLVHDQDATLCWRRDGQMWVRGPDGRQCMTATAVAAAR